MFHLVHSLFSMSSIVATFSHDNIQIHLFQGPDSYYGSKGLRKVTHESVTSGKVTFQFTYAAGNNNGTSVEDGQIPEIIFYT